MKLSIVNAVVCVCDYVVCVGWGRVVCSPVQLCVERVHNNRRFWLADDLLAAVDCPMYNMPHRSGNNR